MAPHPFPRLFETDRLWLRATDVQDARFVLDLLNTPKWHQYIGDRGVRTIEDARRYIQERMLPQLEHLGFGNYTVIRKSDGRKLGSCGLYDREGLEGVDIGFAFLPDCEGKGYGTESALKMKTLAFEVFGVDRISGITVKENIGSQRLLEKIGLRFVEYMHLPNDPEEIMLYRLDRILK